MSMGLRRGYLSGLAAYVMWGFFPIYFHDLRPAGAVEILAHRIVWSAVSVAVLITVIRRWGRFVTSPADRVRSPGSRSPRC